VKNYYKRRGVDNIGNDDKNGVFEHLYKNGIHNKEAMDLLQRRWVEEDNEMTFK
jgi:tRNA(His) 5'-end guanylyltransferase